MVFGLNVQSQMSAPKTRAGLRTGRREQSGRVS
jgi:hypothetical protein